MPENAVNRSHAPQTPLSLPPAALDYFRDVFLHPVAAVAITLLLLALCTWAQVGLRQLTGSDHSFAILYLIPVAISAAFLGTRFGLATALAALLLIRFFLVPHPHSYSPFSDLGLLRDLEIGSLLLGMFAIATVAGRLRATLELLHDSHQRLADAHQLLLDSEVARREFSRDVLLAVTDGKLRLVEWDEAPLAEITATKPILIQRLADALDASFLRQALQHIAADIQMHSDRELDLCTAATEAATNAIKHGKGGEARVWASRQVITVEIADHGDGIAPAHLARATLEKGYSTRVSLGMGFHLMLETCDALILSTSPRGTNVLLQVSTTPSVSESEALLARYAAF